MAVKENSPSGRKRLCLNDNSHIRYQQQHQQFDSPVNNTNNEMAIQQQVLTSSNSNNQDQLTSSGGFDSDSDRYSELFDSFKDTNHLKELHCR